MSRKKGISSETLKEVIIEGMQDLKAKDIVCLDLRNIIGAVADFFIVCHGDSSTHVGGIVNAIGKKTLETIQQKPWHQEGKANAEWILLDYVDVVAHVFQKEARTFYNLEGLWADAPIVKIAADEEQVYTKEK